jgi:hypothetical protein
MKEVKVKLTLDDKDAKKGLKDLNEQVDKTAKSTKKSGEALSGGFAGLKGAIGGAIPMLGRLQAAFASSGIGAIVIAVGSLVGLFTSAVKTGAKFAKSFSTLQAVTGKTADELSELNKQAKELGATTQFTAIEVVSLQTELAKLGFTAKDIENSTPSILDLAASLEVGLASAAELAGSVVRSFGLTTKDTQKVVDVMAKSTSTSALNFEALRESLKVVAPAAKATGVSIEKTAALLGVLANNGLKGSVAGTGLSKTFIELNKKGITLQEAMDKVSGSSNKLNTAIELVGVVGAKSFLSLAEGGDQIAELEEQFENAAGAAKEMAEVRLDNLAGDTTKLGSAWEGFLLSIEDGSNIINNLVRGFTQAATAVLSFLTPTKDLADALEDERMELFRLEGQLYDTNQTQKDRVKVIKELQDKYPDFLANIDAEKVSNEELSDALLSVNDNLVNKIILSRKDKEIQEQANEVADAKIDKLDKEKALAEAIAKNREDFGFKATKGTLEQQAAAQQQMVAESKLTMSLSEKERANRRLRNGLIGLERATNEYNKAESESLELNKAQEKLREDLGMTVKEDTEDKKENTYETTNLTNETKSLIAAQETLLENAKLLPETTEVEIAAKNRQIQLINEEIKRLKELGVIKEEKQKKDTTEADEKARLERLNELEDSRLEAMRDKGAQELAIKENVEKQKRAMEDATINHTKAGIGILSSLAGENKALQATALIADNAVGIAQTIMAASRSIAERKAAYAAIPAFIGTFPNPAKIADVPLLIKDIASTKLAAGIGVATSGIALAKGLAALGKGGAGGGAPQLGGGAEGGAEAPAFNLVEGSESNAIQQSIQGQENAVKAFVVSGDVTTAQSADRRIVEGSGF